MKISQGKRYMGPSSSKLELPVVLSPQSRTAFVSWHQYVTIYIEYSPWGKLTWALSPECLLWLDSTHLASRPYGWSQTPVPPEVKWDLMRSPTLCHVNAGLIHILPHRCHFVAFRLLFGSRHCCCPAQVPLRSVYPFAPSCCNCWLTTHSSPLPWRISQ